MGIAASRNFCSTPGQDKNNLLSMTGSSTKSLDTDDVAISINWRLRPSREKCIATYISDDEDEDEMDKEPLPLYLSFITRQRAKAARMVRTEDMLEVADL